MCNRVKPTNFAAICAWEIHAAWINGGKHPALNPPVAPWVLLCHMQKLTNDGQTFETSNLHANANWGAISLSLASLALFLVMLLAAI